MSAGVFHACGIGGVALKLSATMRNEWQVRGIGDVIPALDAYAGEAVVHVDHATAAEIAEDCRFYIDPKAVDASIAERSAYRALLKQCEAAARGEA